MCDDTTTKLCNNLAAQAIELAMAEQREATIAAALALPEAERYRLWMELGKEFAPVRSDSGWIVESNVATQKSAVQGIRKNFLIDLAKEWTVAQE